MERSGDNVVLLLFGKLYKINGVSRYPYSKLRILFGVLLSVQQGFSCKYIYVEVMSAFFHITIKKFNQIINLFFVWFYICRINLPFIIIIYFNIGLDYSSSICSLG